MAIMGGDLSSPMMAIASGPLAQTGWPSLRLRGAPSSSLRGYNTRESAEDEAIDHASRRLRSISDAERLLVDQVRNWALKASHRPDSKAEALLRWLEEHLQPGGEWSDTRVILFTE